MPEGLCFMKVGIVDWLYFFFDPTRFVQRDHCGLWNDNFIILYMLSNLFIWAAYMLITLLLLFAASSHETITKDKHLKLAFCFFIFFCGMGHLEGVLAFYWPTYHLYAVWDLLTALVSWVTVGMLFGRYQLSLAVKATEDKAKKKISNSDRQ